MFILFLIIALGVALISWTTAPSRHKSSADEYFAKGDISKADELLRKVWTRRDDIPAHLAWMYFELIKKGKLKYVQTVLSIQTNELSEVAKKNLTSVQNDIKLYIEDKASSAFNAYDYTEAIKYNATLIPFGEKYKSKDDEYRVYRELMNYLSSGRKGSALNIYINDNQALVIKCIKNRVKELDIPLDVLKLLSLMLGDKEIKTKFEAALLSYILHFKELPELKGDVDKYQRSFLEDKADSMAESQILDAICIYTAIHKKKPNAAIAEKIELLNYRLASDYIQKEDYNHFKQLHGALKLNSDISANLRYDLDCKYNAHLFKFLSDKLREKALKGEKWDVYLNCCAEYASHSRSEELFDVARDLYTQERSGESLKLCRLLINSEQRVFDLVLSNVINLLSKSTKYGSLSEVYDKDELLPLLAEKCFEYAATLGNQGDFAKAVYIERLTEPYFPQDSCYKYDVLITHYLSYAMSFSDNKLPEQLDIVFKYLRKVKDRTIIEKHYKALEGFAASFLSVGKATKAYEVSKRIYDKSKEASRLFLDSALILAQKKKLKDSYGLAVAIAMQDDALAEAVKFIPYFPGELRHPYVVGYARKVVELYKGNQQSAIDFYSQQPDIDLREEILVEISKSDSLVLKTLVIDIVNNKESKLPKATHYADTVVDFLINNVTADEKRFLLKDLVLWGYNYRELYINAVLDNLTESTSPEEKLAAVNEALVAVEDRRLYEIKHDIAVSYIETDPQKVLSICSEIENKVDTKASQLKCHIKLAENLDSLDEKYEHLKSAKRLCSKREKTNNKKIHSLAFSLATALYVSGATEKAYSVYEEFNILETTLTELASVSDISTIREQHLGLVGLASTIFLKGKSEEAYEISKRIYNISKEASRIFLDSALELAKTGKLTDSFGLSEAITLQDDILAETLNFIPYFAYELRQPYVVGYANRVIELYTSEPQSSLDFFNQQKDLDLRGEILIEISKVNNTVFHGLIIDILNDKQNKLPKDLHYSSVVIELISEKTNNFERILLLKDLVVSGYNGTKEYIKAVIASLKDLTSLEEELDAINDALGVVEDKLLFKNKQRIAASYIDENPQRSLTICSEIERKISVRDIQLKCHIKLAATAESLDTKHCHLSAAKDSCESIKQAEYAEIIKLASSLATSYFVIGKSEEGYSILREFPGGETELAYRTRRLEDTRSLAGDAAACKALKELIDECHAADYPEDRENDESFHKIFDAKYYEIWDEYIRRNLHKADKQQPEKAITSLVGIVDEVRNKFIHPEGQKFSNPLIEKIAELAYGVGYEYEENQEYGKAQEYYELSNKYIIGDFSAMGRSILCQLKSSTPSYNQLSKKVQLVLGKVPGNIEKDIVYRFVLLALKEDYVTEAATIAEERLRDKKLLDLCESYKVRKVQSQINDLNEQIALIRDKKLGYLETKALYDSLESKMEPIINVFPEYRYKVAEFKNGIFTYMLKVAQKEERYDVLYAYFSKGSSDFIKDKSRFRNLAATCLGMIEQGSLNASNYKKIISIWLTAVYNDYLIVRSLDHTKWDDLYTFTLDDSLSQTYGYNDLPDNINYDRPSESNISIGHVQKSLLERSDVALSNGNKKYYDFYLEQRKAMDAYAAIKYKELSPSDTKENIIAPYALTEMLPTHYMEQMKSSLNTGNKEHGYRVGYMYGFTDEIFAAYNKAITNYEVCVTAARSLKDISTAFMSRKISSIRKFSSLYTKFVSELISILENHIGEGTTYKKLRAPFGTICKMVNNDTLSYKYTDYINAQVIRLVNNDTLGTADGLKILYEIYKIYNQNHTVQKNVSGMLIKLISDYLLENSEEDFGTINDILNDTNDFNNDILDFLSQDGLAVAICIAEKQSRLTSILYIIKSNDESTSSRVASVKSTLKDAKAQIDNMKLQHELSEIVDQVNNNSMSGLTALQKVYAIYKKAQNDSRICENMAIIANRCMHEYIPSDKLGVSTVRTTLDDLFRNRSTMFNSKRNIFRDALNNISSGLTFEQKKLLGIIESSSVNTTGLSLNEEGKRVKVLISYLKKFAND